MVCRRSPRSLYLVGRGEQSMLCLARRRFRRSYHKQLRLELESIRYQLNANTTDMNPFPRFFDELSTWIRVFFNPYLVAGCPRSKMSVFFPLNVTTVSPEQQQSGIMMSLLSLATLCLNVLHGISPAATQPYCKPIPGSPDWPSIVQWRDLNTSVSGRLIAPVPPGVVCHTKNPLHNTAACTQLYSQWSNSSFHAGDPFTTDYNDDSCLPSSMAPCSAAPLPAYVVKATNAEDVQAAVRFAHRTGVRLIVKGTGHDYPGRYL